MEAVTASEMLEEFRLMEGTLFQDEEAKLFYLDVKGVVLDSLVAAWDKFSTSDVLYQTALDRYYSWDGAVGHEEVERCTSDVHNVSERHFHVAVFYSRQLYGNEDFHKKIVIAKPKIEVLLKTLFRRLVRNIHVKSGSFFSFDPVKQDFILRDAFRQALAESIKIVEISSSKEKEKVKSENKPLERERESNENDNEGDEEGDSDTKNKTKNEKEKEEEEGLKNNDENDNEGNNVEPSEEQRLNEEEEKEKPIENANDEKENEVKVKEEEQVKDDKDKDKEEDFDVKKVPEDYNVGDSISVFLEREPRDSSISLTRESKESDRRSVLKIPTMVRTVFLT